MKKSFVLTGILCVVILLAACDAAGQSATPPTGGQGGTPANGGERDLPVTMKLILGTFKLEGTEYPVDAEQAKQLLPLWKAVRSLSNSDTTAPQEMNALMKQIQNVMEPEQMKTIEAMNLSFQDMRSISQEMGLDLGGGMGNRPPGAQTTRQASGQGGPPGGFAPGGGGLPGQGGGPGGMGGGQGGSFNQGARQTAVAERGGGSRTGTGVDPVMLDAIIKFLEAKVQ